MNLEHDEFVVEWYARGLPAALGPAIVKLESLATVCAVRLADRGPGELIVRTSAIATTNVAAAIVAIHTRPGCLVVLDSRATVPISTSLLPVRLVRDA
jgi:hypothetical protein